MVGLEKGARGLLLAASVLAASGVSARADEAAPPAARYRRRTSSRCFRGSTIA
jgi:hypothetical protein